MARGLGGVFSDIAATVAGSAALTAAGAPVAAVLAADAVGLAGAASRAVTAFSSPYILGDYRSGLSPVSVARIPARGRADGGQGGGQALGAHDYLARFIAPEQETRQAHHVLQGGAINAATRPLGGAQETRNWQQYDAGRIRAEIDTLGDRYRDHGMDTRPQDASSGLPLQTIRDHEGRVLMQGHALSVEHLIAQKLSEAEKSTDPSKKVVNLAGADLGGQKLDFKGFNFANVDLRGANLSGASFFDCKFENCDMQGVNLKGVQFDNCHLENVNMNEFEGDKRTVFKNTSMQNVHMERAVAPEIRFENIRAENLNLAGAYMAGASITDMKVNNLWAPEANLEGARIGGLQVIGRDSSLEDAKLNGAKLHNVSFGTPEYGINMRGIQMRNTVQTDVQYNASDISNSDFSGTEFKYGVDMRRAVTSRGAVKMYGSDLTGLTAGRDCKIETSHFTYGEGASKVSFQTQGGAAMVFDGTADIERLHKVARSNDLSFIHIRESDGAAINPTTGKALTEMEMRQNPQVRRMNPQMAPAPTMPGMKKPPWQA